MKSGQLTCCTERRQEGVQSKSGLQETVSVLRDRSQSMRPTIMTSNLKPNKIEQVYSADLAALLRETMIPLRISGYDWRAVKAEELRQML